MHRFTLKIVHIVGIASVILFSNCTKTKRLPTPPTVHTPGISTLSINATSTPATVSLSWEPAVDSSTPANKLVYSVCVSEPNPAAGSFSTITEILAGTCLKQTGITTATLDVMSGHSYYFNIVVTNKFGLQSVYLPLGEIVDTSLVDYYPFDDNTSDVVTTPGFGGQNLSAATYTNQAISPVTTSGTIGSLTVDRFGNKNMAYYFTQFVDQCLMSPNTVNSTVTGHNPRTITFWTNLGAVSNNNQVPLSIGNYLNDGSHFGIYISTSTDNPWNEWFWGEDVTSSVNSSISAGWQFWTITYVGDSTCSSPGICIGTIYLNGMQVGQRDFHSSTPPDTDPTSPFWVGCGVDGNTPASYDGTLKSFYTGGVDDIRIFNRVLCDGTGNNGCTSTSTNEIGYLYALTAPLLRTNNI